MPLFRRKNTDLTDFSVLQTDLHSHVLPGLDDGSPTLEESIRMLNSWAALGFRKIIATPHVINAMYPNTKERIMGQMYHLQDVLEENHIPLTIEASAEYRLDGDFRVLIEKDELIPFGPENFLLVEYPWQPSPHPEKILFELIVAGYTPILAHPERYDYLTRQKDALWILKDKGVLFQLNIHSLRGAYGKIAQKTATLLVRENMVDFLGSDAHHNQHLLDMKAMLRNPNVRRLLESGTLRNHELTADKP